MSSESLAADDDFMLSLTPEQRKVLLELIRRKKESEERTALLAEQERLKKLVAKTDYVSYLCASQKMFLSLRISEETMLTSDGARLTWKKPTLTSADAVFDFDGKYYPLHLREWDKFPALHDDCQDKLMSTLGDGKYFDSEYVLDHWGRVAGKDPVRHEEDVKRFVFLTVEHGAHIILKRYLGLRQETNPSEKLLLDISFRSRPRGLQLQDEDVPGTPETPAYTVDPPDAYRPDSERRKMYMDDEPGEGVYPGQWGFNKYGEDNEVPIFVVEYKAAHKLRADAILKALASVVDASEAGGLFTKASSAVDGNEPGMDKDIAAEYAKKELAQVIVQALNYMVEFGLCYSYVTTGEALLLLYLDPADPLTLYYHLGLPGRDVGTVDEATQDLSKLKHTANALVLTLALLAAGTPPLSQGWKMKAKAALKPWPEPYDQQEASGTGRHVSSLGQKTDDADNSGHKDTDSNKKPESEKTQAVVRNQLDSGSSSQHGGTSGHIRAPAPYCTQACLLGLRYGGMLDEHCPNVQRHRLGEADNNQHLLSAEDFLARMREQLAHDLDDDCEGLDKSGKFGATGMLFRLELQPHGYTLVAKGVQQAHVSMLLHEFRIYSEPRTMAQQGRLVPVCLGMIRLEVEYVSYTGAHITHMLLLSYGGEPLWTKTKSPMLSAMETAAREAWDELLRLGVLHGDERSPNVVWNEELQRVMCIDFGQAELKPPPRKKRRAPA